MKLFSRFSLISYTIRHLCIILFFFTQIHDSSFAQKPIPEILRLSEKCYSEKLYVKTDREIYISGEKVWMKIYKLNGLNSTPGNVSKVVYIELLDTDNNPINQLKAAIDVYSGSAVFRLPDTLKTGNYFIRSFTQWMQNFSEELYSYKKISVINPFKIDEILIPSIHPGADNIIFFPEGGNLISGIQGKIGFKSLNKDGEPVAIRGAIINGRNDTLTRVETGQPLNYKIALPDKKYTSREKIDMTITATDDRGNPVESDFSVSVAKAVTVSGKTSEIDKLTQLPGLLPYNSDRQFSDINDLLIFYNSHDLISDADGKFINSEPPFLPELEGHLISGNIKYRKTGEPVRNENVSLSFVGKKALCQFAKTNEKGEFHFNTSEHGTREIVIQPLSDQIMDYYVELKSPFTPAIKKYNPGMFLPDTSKLSEINSVIISSQINNIYEPYTPAAGNSPATRAKPDFYGKPDNTILLSKYIELTSLKEVVKEIIPGVSTVKKNDKVNFRLYYQFQSQPFENNPLVLVDGVPVYDLDKVISINSRDMEKIDVFTTRYYISDIVMDGILHFVTKKGNLDVIDLDRSVYHVQYDFPETRHDFYSPDYSTDKLLNDRIPDFRNTLYWNAEMHTNKTGNAAIEFYSSDESGKYVITVEGITSDGKTGSISMPLIINSR